MNCPTCNSIRTVAQDIGICMNCASLFEVDSKGKSINLSERKLRNFAADSRIINEWIKEILLPGVSR